MDKIKFDFKLSKIEELLENNKYYDVIDLAKELLNEASDYENKQAFNNGIEYYLYLTTYTNKIEKQELNYKKLLDSYGTALMLTNKLIEARSIFEKSLEIDPFDSLTRFKYVETFKLTNELDEYFKASNEAINYCYKAIDFQRFYRNISEYYFRHENYVEALYMMLFSKYVYEENAELISPELFRIYDCLGKELDPSIDAVMNFMENKKINLPSHQIEKLNYIYLKIKDNDPITTYDLLKVLYELTNNNSYKVLLDEFDKLNKVN